MVCVATAAMAKSVGEAVADVLQGGSMLPITKLRTKIATPEGSGYSCCAPSMGALPEVQVLPQADHSERSEAQLHEGDRVWEGSVERKS
jgi:hypothetical protein